MQCGDRLWFGGDAVFGCVEVVSMSQSDRFELFFSLSLSSARVDVPIQPAQVVFFPVFSVLSCWCRLLFSNLGSSSF